MKSTVEAPSTGTLKSQKKKNCSDNHKFIIFVIIVCQVSSTNCWLDPDPICKKGLPLNTKMQYSFTVNTKKKREHR